MTNTATPKVDVKAVIQTALDDGETIDRVGTYQAIHDALLQRGLLSPLAVENPDMAYTRIVHGVCADSPADDRALDVFESLAFGGMLAGISRP